MDNSNLNEIDFNLKFDFNNDFTTAENHVIDELLLESFDSTYGNEVSVDENPLNSLANFNLSCDNLMDEMNVFMDNHSNSSNAATDNFPYFPQQSEDENQMNAMPIIGNGNLMMSWMNCVYQPESIKNDLQMKNADAIGVSNDNVCSTYQELETFDIPKLYSDLETVYGLKDLRDIDAYLNYSSLTPECSNEKQFIFDESNATKKRKIFLLPIHCDNSETESVKHLGEKLKSRTDILHSIMNRLNDNSISKYKETKILLIASPKQKLQKSERYLSVEQQLNRIENKNVDLPRIKNSIPLQRKRKQSIKCDSSENVNAHVHSLFNKRSSNIICGRIIGLHSSSKENQQVLAGNNATENKNGSIEVSFADIRCRRSLRIYNKK